MANVSKRVQAHMDRWALRRTVAKSMMVTYKEYATCVNAVYIIQRKWRVCIADPAFKVCRSRLDRECQEMSRGA